MSYNDNVKELLRNHGIHIGLNSREEYSADIRGRNENQKVAGYYLRPSVNEPLSEEKRAAQEYFYRAMGFTEAARWIAAWGNSSPITQLQEVLEDKGKGIHFATGAKYSMQYITGQSDEAVLLEFHSPGLVKKFQKIGVGRKNEGGRDGRRVGDMSYGIGYSETIALAPTNEINNKIDEKYNKYKDSEIVVKLREWWDVTEGCLLEDKRRLLKIFYFLKELQSIRIIYVKNEPHEM